MKLKLASVLERHGCDGMKVFTQYADMSDDDIRKALVEYRKAAEANDWHAAENAILKLFQENRPAKGLSNLRDRK